MTNDYTQLIYNVDSWYDNINDVHEHSFNNDGDTIDYSTSYPRFHQYMYTYLSCISEFSDDIE